MLARRFARRPSLFDRIQCSFARAGVPVTPVSPRSPRSPRSPLSGSPRERDRPAAEPPELTLGDENAPLNPPDDPPSHPSADVAALVTKPEPGLTPALPCASGNSSRDASFSSTSVRTLPKRRGFGLGQSSASWSQSMASRAQSAASRPPSAGSQASSAGSRPRSAASRPQSAGVQRSFEQVWQCGRSVICAADRPHKLFRACSLRGRELLKAFETVRKVHQSAVAAEEKFGLIGPGDRGNQWVSRRRSRQFCPIWYDGAAVQSWRAGARAGVPCTSDCLAVGGRGGGIVAPEECATICHVSVPVEDARVRNVVSQVIGWVRLKSCAWCSSGNCGAEKHHGLPPSTSVTGAGWDMGLGQASSYPGTPPTLHKSAPMCCASGRQRCHCVSVSGVRPQPEHPRVLR